MAKKISSKKIAAVKEKSIHPWRLCSYGRHWVREHSMHIPPSKKNPGGSTTIRHAHCANSPSGKDQLYSDEIGEMARSNFSQVKEKPCPLDLGFKEKGAAYDDFIAGWTKYWNDVLKPQELLSPNIVKALIASESGFNPEMLANKKNSNSARGLMQILNSTRKNLGDEKGELQDHYLTVTKTELNDPNTNICAGIRWLFQKQKLASSYLGRDANWEEAVMNYKGKLKSKPEDVDAKNHNKKYLLIPLFILILPIFSYAVDGKFEKKQFGLYKVSLSQDFQSGIGKLVIKKGNEKVFEESEIDNHYSFGNEFDPVLQGKDLYSGRDITGNGYPNVVVSNWTGGAHCCHFLHIFEVGKKFKELITVQANSSSVRIADLDHDGFPEIEFLDGAIDYLFACFAGSPGGRVVLKFKKDHYEVASELMKSSPPTPQEIRKLKEVMIVAFKKIDNPDLPYDFLNTMMELSYSGHFNLALKLADEVWPVEKPGLMKFKDEFSKALHESIYWKDL